jgi:hypothetical protein
MKHTHAIALIILSLTLTACVARESARTQTASHIASPSFMTDRKLDAGGFTLTLFERIHDRGGIANLYIEGDNALDSKNPTPVTPVALQLASRDKSKNVIIISRPCQYQLANKKWLQTPNENEVCDLKYANENRFAPEVISSYNSALDELKKRWGISAFNLYGHAGGGAIAALVAAERSDILSITTVAGMLDNSTYTKAATGKAKQDNQTLPLLSSTSLNAKDVAAQLAKLPQYHYIGSADKITPPSAIHNYLAAAGPNNCVQYKIIQENDYNGGWTEKWPDLLKDKPVCKNDVGTFNDVINEWN